MSQRQAVTKAKARACCSSPSRAGGPNAEIGQELHISMSTVKFHLASLMTKLGARNGSVAL